MSEISEHRFLIETSADGNYFHKGLIVQREKYVEHGNRQKRHESLAKELGIVSPVGGICSLLDGSTLLEFVRASSSVLGATEEQMQEAYSQGGITLVD